MATRTLLSMPEIHHEGVVLMALPINLLPRRPHLEVLAVSILPTGQCSRLFRVEIMSLVIFSIALLPIQPEAIIDKLIIEIKFSLTRPLILDKIPLVNIPIVPVINPVPMLPVKHVMSLIVLFVVRIKPDSVSISKSLLKITSIVRFVFPGISSKTLWQSIDKLP